MRLSEWLENHLLPCAYEQIFGIECPVCGFQRSLVELLNGNIIESLFLYPPLIPSLLLIIVFFVHLLIRTGLSRKILLWFARADLLIITVSYIWKLAA